MQLLLIDQDWLVKHGIHHIAGSNVFYGPAVPYAVVSTAFGLVLNCQKKESLDYMHICICFVSLSQMSSIEYILYTETVYIC